METPSRILQISSQISLLPNEQINPLLISIYESIQIKRQDAINRHLEEIKKIEDSYNELTTVFLPPGCGQHCQSSNGKDL